MKCTSCKEEILATLDKGTILLCYNTKCKLYGREILSNMKQIKVDLDKWENLVRLAKASGSLFDGNNDPEDDKRARLEVYKEYELFCDWRHTEPYRSGNFEGDVIEKARLEGFRWGINYLAVLINNSTLISELYGWKSIVDMSVEKAHELTKKNIPDNMKIEVKIT